jgi:hypothetical protein
MPLREEWLLLPHHSLQTSYFQATAYGLSREELAGDVGKRLGHIHSSGSPPRPNKMISMMNVDRRKLGRAASKRLWEVRTMVRVKHRDSANTVTSSRCYIQHQPERIWFCAVRGRGHMMCSGASSVIELYYISGPCSHMTLLIII